MAKKNAFVVNVPTKKTAVVAVRSIGDSRVIAHGTKSSSVAKKTRQQKTPVLMHVPQQGKTYVY